MLDTFNLRQQEPDRNIIPPPIHMQLKQADLVKEGPGRWRGRHLASLYLQYLPIVCVWYRYEGEALWLHGWSVRH